MASGPIPAMPTQVRVGGMIYRIVPYTMRESLDNDRMGECRNDRPEIALADWLGPAMRADVLWHEIGHAIWYRWSLPDSAAEEAVVDAYTKGLMAVWNDNPDLVAWTQAVLSGQADAPLPPLCEQAAE